jgi:hypothetical protein
MIKNKTYQIWDSKTGSGKYSLHAHISKDNKHSSIGFLAVSMVCSSLWLCLWWSVCLLPHTCVKHSPVLNGVNEARLLDQPGANKVLSQSYALWGACDGHFAVRGSILSVRDLDVGTRHLSNLINFLATTANDATNEVVGDIHFLGLLTRTGQGWGRGPRVTWPGVVLKTGTQT